MPGGGDHHLPNPGGAVGPGIDPPVGEEPQQVQTNQGGAAVEHRGPGVAAQKVGQRRPQKAADVDQHVKEPPARPGGFGGQGFDKGPLDRGLEDRGARGQHQATGEEGPKLALGGHHQVAQPFQQDRHHDLPLVAVAVGEAAGEHRQGRLHQGPPQEDETLVALAEVEAADLVGLGDVDGDDHPHPVVGQALGHLHEIGHPKRPGQAPGLLPERRWVICWAHKYPGAGQRRRIPPSADRPACNSANYNGKMVRISGKIYKFFCDYPFWFNCSLDWRLIRSYKKREESNQGKPR